MFPKVGYHGMLGSEKFFAGLEFQRTHLWKRLRAIDISAIEVSEARDRHNPAKGRELTDCTELPHIYAPITTANVYVALDNLKYLFNA